MERHIIFTTVLLLSSVIYQKVALIPQNYPKIISYTNDVYEDRYNFAFETEDGVKRIEKGEFVNGIWTVIGSTTWTDKDGKPRIYAFKADDKGVVLNPSSVQGK